MLIWDFNHRFNLETPENNFMEARLLYVGDGESLSFVTRDNLELQGYEVIHCADGKVALEQLLCLIHI